jgi:hypothetical protein
MPLDAKLTLRSAETVKVLRANPSAPQEQSERPAGAPVTRREAAREQPERPVEKVMEGIGLTLLTSGLQHTAGGDVRGMSAYTLRAA